MKGRKEEQIFEESKGGGGGRGPPGPATQTESHSEGSFESVFDIVRRLQYNGPLGGRQAETAAAAKQINTQLQQDSQMSQNAVIDSEDDHQITFQWKPITNPKMKLLNSTNLHNILISSSPTPSTFARFKQAQQQQQINNQGSAAEQNDLQNKGNPQHNPQSQFSFQQQQQAFNNEFFPAYPPSSQNSYMQQRPLQQQVNEGRYQDSKLNYLDQDGADFTLKEWIQESDDLKSGYLYELRPISSGNGGGCAESANQYLQQQNNISSEEDSQAPIGGISSMNNAVFLNALPLDLSGNKQELTGRLGAQTHQLMLDLTHRKKVVIGGAPTPTYIVVDNYSDECQLLKMETKRFFMLRKGKLYKFKRETTTKTIEGGTTSSSVWVPDKVLDLRNRLVDLVTLQRSEGDQQNNYMGGCGLQPHNSPHSVSRRQLVQAIQVRSLKRTYYFMAGPHPTSGSGRVASALGNSSDGCGSSLGLSQDLSSGGASGTEMMMKMMAATRRKKGEIIEWFDSLRPFSINMNLKTQYEIGSQLGKGNFASVYEATHYATGKKYAVKTIEKKMILSAKRNLIALVNEVNLVRKLSLSKSANRRGSSGSYHGAPCENVIHMHEVFESENNVHIVLEYLQGGELFEKIKSNGTYDEVDAAKIMRALLTGLQTVHQNSIVHRDIKPENILFGNETLDSLKIVDFGLSASCKEGPLFMKCGSPGYVAPEILNDTGYECKADVFSAGIILYILLTGKFVFSGRNYREILQKNRDCDVPYPVQYWDQRSPHVKDFISRILTKWPQDRLSATEALKHPWFRILDTQDHGDHFQVLSQNRSLKFSFEDVNVTSGDEEFESEIHSSNLNHAIISTVRGSRPGDIEDTSPFWNFKRIKDEDEKTNMRGVMSKLQTYNTPIPNPRMPLNVMKSQNQSLNSGSQEVVLSGGIVIKNFGGSNLQSKLSRDCGIDDFGSKDSPFQQDFSSLVKKQFHQQFRNSDKFKFNQQQQAVGQVQKNLMIPMGSAGAAAFSVNQSLHQIVAGAAGSSHNNYNPSTFQHMNHNNSSRDNRALHEQAIHSTKRMHQASKGIKKEPENIYEQRISLEQSKEIEVLMGNIPNPSNSPRISSSGSESHQALSIRVQPQTVQQQLMTFNNHNLNVADPRSGSHTEPNSFHNKTSEDPDQRSYSNQAHRRGGYAQQFQVNNSKGEEGARHSSCSSGDEVSINEEDLIDEIPEEDDRSKSGGYSSAGLSIYNANKPLSSAHQDKSNFLVNLKGLSGGAMSEGYNTGIIDFKLANNSGFMKFTNGAQIAGGMSTAPPLVMGQTFSERGNENLLNDRFTKCKSQMQGMQSQNLHPMSSFVSRKIRKNQTAAAEGGLTVSREMNLDAAQNRSQIQIANDAENQNGVPSKMCIVPTTPGSVFGGSRNVLKHSQHTILESQFEEEDGRSLNLKKSSQKSGGSGEPKNPRGSFTLDQLSNEGPRLAAGAPGGGSSFHSKAAGDSRLAQGKLKLFDDSQRVNTGIKSYHTGALLAAGPIDFIEYSNLDSDQIKTKKIPFRQAKDEVLFAESFDLQLDHCGVDMRTKQSNNMQLPGVSGEEEPNYTLSGLNMGVMGASGIGMASGGGSSGGGGSLHGGSRMSSVFQLASTKYKVGGQVGDIKEFSFSNNQTTMAINYQNLGVSAQGQGNECQKVGKGTSLFANRSHSKFSVNQQTQISNSIQKMRSGEDNGQEEALAPSSAEQPQIVYQQPPIHGAYNVVEAIEEDMEEDKNDYNESEFSLQKFRQKRKRFLPQLVQSSEGSGSGAGNMSNYNPETQKPREPEGVPSEHGEGLGSHSFHTANSGGGVDDLGSAGYQSIKRIGQRDSSEHIALGTDSAHLASRSGSNPSNQNNSRVNVPPGSIGFVGVPGLGGSIGPSHFKNASHINSILARDFEPSSINNDHQFKQHLKTYEAQKKDNFADDEGSGAYEYDDESSSGYGAAQAPQIHNTQQMHLHNLSLLASSEKDSQSSVLFHNYQSQHQKQSATNLMKQSNMYNM